jgi:hypothetical protein
MLRAAALILAVPFSALAAEAPAFVVETLREGVGRASARATIREYRPTLPAGCVADVAHQISAPDLSGRAMLKLGGTSASGGRCEGFATVRASLTASVLVATRAVAKDQPLEGAFTLSEKDVTGHPEILSELPAGAVASQAVVPGVALTERMVRLPGPATGESVPVVVQSGPISITQDGRLAACGTGHTCATLPSGKRVEGRLVDGKLLVEAR